jgi:PAS domain S-box-containing protein
MRAASGEVLYYEGTVEDITDRRRAEEALRESEIKLSAIFNNSVDGIFVAKDDLCVMANPALLRMLRCPTAADVVGQPVTRRVAPEDAARVAENIRRRARGEPAPTLTEATVLRLDGTTFLAEGHNSIYVLNGEQYLLTILRDITERKSTDLLKMQLEVLRQVDKLRAQLVGNVSHELRTPLGLILGIAAILRQTEPPMPESERQEFLKDIEEEAERLAAIVDGLLDAERMQAGRLVLRRRRLDLRLVVTAETEALVRRDRQHHFAVELPERPVWGDLDANRLGQVVHNLLDNAIKYTPADTTIRTRVERRQAELWVSVEDEGPGIPSDQLERIFERFHRLTEQNDTTTPGLGLGLAICRGIVEMHGGRIWAESPVALGRGSRFVFTLPEMAPTQEGKSDEY